MAMTGTEELTITGNCLKKLYWLYSMCISLDYIEEHSFILFPLLHAHGSELYIVK